MVGNFQGANTVLVYTIQEPKQSVHFCQITKNYWKLMIDARDCLFGCSEVNSTC